VQRELSLDFDTVWKDILKTLAYKRRIETLCRRSRNYVIRIKPNTIIVRSLESGKLRRIRKKDVEHVWKVLQRNKRIKSLNELSELKNKRISAIVCSILASLDYVRGECKDRKVVLEFIK